MLGRRGIASLLMAGTAGIALAAPAFAQDDHGRSEMGEATSSADIIVTARRSEERLQDVPISITVFNSEQVANRNIVNAGDLGTYTPSLSTNGRYGPEKSSFAIRGFVQEGKTAPSVGVYFADVVAPRSNGGTTSGNGAGAGAFFDLQSVQVLKGPQGTLFGRNTTGGAILLTPQKPTSDLGGYVQGTIGNYRQRRIEAVLNVPLSETFRVRAGVDYNKRDGYLKNHSGIGPDALADVNYVAARLSIVGDLTPDLENYTIGSFSYSDTNGATTRIVTCNRGSTSLFARLGCAQVDRQAARGDSIYDIESSAQDPYMRFRTFQLINTTTWKASDNLTIKNIVSYAEFRERSHFSLQGDNFSIGTTALPVIELYPGITGSNSEQSTFTEELQFQGTAANGAFNWQLGLYQEISKPLNFSSGYTPILLNCTNPAAYQCTDVIGAGSISSANTADSFNNKGIYAQGTYKLTDQLSLTGGIRYTSDKTTSVGQNVNIRFPTPNNPVFACQNNVAFNTDPVLLTPLPITSFEQCRLKFQIKSDKPTWVIDAEYKPTPDMLLYAKWSRGYRQGGINTNNIGLETWGPEKVDTYELGAKTSFRGAVSGYFNVTGFYNDFRDQQIAASLLPLPAYTGRLGGAQAIVNAGKSRIYGVEVDSSITLFRDLRIDAGYTYLNTRLQALNLPVAPALYQPLTSSAVVGGELALSPKHKLSISANYTLPLDESIGQITFGATYTYTAKNIVVSPLVTPAPLNSVPESNLVNLNASWNNVLGAPIDVSAFVTNLTKEAYFVYPTSSYNSFGFDGGSPNVPRMFGVRLKYRFGN